MLWGNRGVARGLEGDLDGGIADMTRAIELDARDAMAWASRGRLRMRKGDLAGAVADLETAAELSHGDPAIQADLDTARARAR